MATMTTMAATTAQAAVVRPSARKAERQNWCAAAVEPSLCAHTKRWNGVKSGDAMKLKIGGDCGIVLNKLLCRVDKSFKLEVHIDTDEGNAADLDHAAKVELYKL